MFWQTENPWNEASRLCGELGFRIAFWDGLGYVHIHWSEHALYQQFPNTIAGGKQAVAWLQGYVKRAESIALFTGAGQA